MDMSATVVPKSDQMNADDLISGPMTVTITKVSGTGNADQPVAVYFEGDNNKPFKPCKSMRRVMITAWGPDAAQYPGRAMTLYRDPKVAFGGMEVGGIRISHMSHIERDLSMALTVTKAKRATYLVKVLKQAPAAPTVALVVVKPGKDAGEYVAPSVEKWMDACARAIAAQPDAPALGAWRMAMAPHFMAAEHVDVGAVDHVQGVAQRRLDELADAAPA
jgi:hypothetical protein